MPHNDRGGPSDDGQAQLLGVKGGGLAMTAGLGHVYVYMELVMGPISDDLGPPPDRASKPTSRKAYAGS